MTSPLLPLMNVLGGWSGLLKLYSRSKCKNIICKIEALNSRAGTPLTYSAAIVKYCIHGKEHDSTDNMIFARGPSTEILARTSVLKR